MYHGRWVGRLDLPTLHELDRLCKSDHPDVITALRILEEIGELVMPQPDEEEDISDPVAARGQGRKRGTKPYGTEKGEKRTVEAIMAAWQATKNYSEVMRLVNREGRRTRRGKEWSVQGIKDVIQREEARLGNLSK